MDMDDLVSIGQASETSRILDRNHSVASRMLDRNYSASSNDTKTMTPGSNVGEQVVKSQLTTQEISRLYYEYEQKDMHVLDHDKTDEVLPDEVESSNVRSILVDTDMISNTSVDDDILDNDEEEKEFPVANNHGRGGGQRRGREDNQQFVGHGRGGAQEPEALITTNEEEGHDTHDTVIAISPAVGSYQRHDSEVSDTESFENRKQVK